MELALLISIVVLSVTIPAFAHACAARREGDATAERAGRVTFNPTCGTDAGATYA
jgi:hypothetical protein